MGLRNSCVALLAHRSLLRVEAFAGHSASNGTRLVVRVTSLSAGEDGRPAALVQRALQGCQGDLLSISRTWPDAPAVAPAPEGSWEAVSESGRLRHGNEAHGRGDRRRRALVSTILSTLHGGATVAHLAPLRQGTARRPSGCQSTASSKHYPKI